jgi:hypothetical protein
MRARSALGIGTLALASIGCGKSASDPPGANASGGNLSGGNASGGSAGASGGSAAASDGGGPSSGGATAGGSASASGGSPVSSGGNGGQGAVDAACPGHQSFIRIAGQLPALGSDVTLRSGCPDSLLGPYPTAASFTGGSGESAGTWVSVLACSEDGSSELLLGLHFTWNRTSGSTPVSELSESSLRYFVNHVSYSLPITELTEAQKPLQDWAAVSAPSQEGVGKVYEGSFVAEGSPAGTQLRVTGDFSVCHVANLPKD